ncbi:MAG TPA: tRNA (adenosine(37)-N6)-threonylcarbamoyltransferase complex dimerization subunit type 1 TsaB [Actinomycetes bacterium]
MKLLAIETSTSWYSVTLDDGGTTHETEVSSRFDVDYDGIGGLVHRQLAMHGCRGADISDIAVNSGPGNLTSVRAGLSYANGLAFATGASIHHTNTLAIIAFMAKQAIPLEVPVLVLHPARGRQRSLFFTGLFTTDGAASYGVKQVAELRTLLSTGIPEVILAGDGAQFAQSMLDTTTVHNSQVVSASSRALVEMFKRGLLVESKSPVTPIAPTTDESGISMAAPD